MVLVVCTCKAGKKQHFNKRTITAEFAIYRLNFNIIVTMHNISQSQKDTGGAKCHTIELLHLGELSDCLSGVRG